MEYTIFDIEADGLLSKATKIHCLAYKIFNNKEVVASGSLTDYDEIRNFLLHQKILVGHNIVRYDIPVIKKLLGIEVTAKLIDTLAISWYHYPISKFRHGLEAWGERLGFPKPVIKDWKNLKIEEYIHRCTSDVEINSRLFHMQMDYTLNLYNNNLDDVLRIFGYLSFKMDSLREQEEEGIALDVRLVEQSKYNLEFEIQEKIDNLSKHMPKVPVKKAPKIMYKKDGTLSVNGMKWKKLLKELNLPEDTKTIYEPGNPGSPTQLKDWLLELGWQPITFKVSKNTGEKLPQVSLPFGGGLCSSVKAMFEQYPYLKDLEGLYKAKHRYGLFKSFLENKDENDRIYATAHGFTNTLRMQHSKPVVNLPSINSYYGKEIRGALTVPNEDYIMCGSDISGLEDNTKQHYIYFFDPDYVTEMRVPGFDPHIDIGLLAELITPEEAEFYKNFDLETATEEEKEKYHKIKEVRGYAKRVNFSATYGAGPPKIAEALNCSLEFATKLHKTYWKRNAAVKKTANACVVKTVPTKYFTAKGVKIVNQQWLFNPLSGFWMFLKSEKDRFSTLNQSSGVYVFDSWLRKVRTALKPLGIKVVMQYHDELMLVCKKEQQEEVDSILKQAMKEVNEEINLNVEIGISVDWGENYASVH